MSGVIAATVSVFCSLARADEGNEEITVVLVAPLSGNLVRSGIDAKLGVESAIAVINDAGGVLGRRLRLVAIDDACDPDQAEAAAEVAVSMHPAVVVGHVCSSASIRAAPLYAKAGIIQISPSSTSARFTELGVRTLFRMIGRDDRQGAMAADLILRRWPGRPIALLDDGGVYGGGLSTVVRRELLARGAPIALMLSFQPGADRYQEIIDALRTRSIGVIYVGAYAPDVAVLARDIAAAGPPIPIVTGNNALSAETFEIAGLASNAILFTAPPLDPGGEASADEKASDHHLAKHARSIHGFTAVEAWVAGVRRAGTLESGAVVAQLKGGPVETVMGAVTFDEKGDLVGPAAAWTWFRWRDGRVERDAE